MCAVGFRCCSGGLWPRLPVPLGSASREAGWEDRAPALPGHRQEGTAPRTLQHQPGHGARLHTHPARKGFPPCASVS